MSSDVWRIAGGRALQGRVRPAGSKNGALPTLAAALLLEGETVLHNVPRITDTATMMGLLRGLGVAVEERADGGLMIVNRGISTQEAPADLVGRMRASHYVLGPMLLQLGKAEMALPGGCRIGARPMRHVLEVFEALGARTEVEKERIVVSCSGLRGATVRLDPKYRSAGATFTALMAASRAEGTTRIENASGEPDVVRFCEFLTAAGARIEGVGEATLVVHGVERLTGTTHRVNSDRLEAGTLICAAAATRGEVVVEGIARAELGETADKLEEAGVELAEEEGGLLARCSGRPHGVEIATGPFPMFSTDLQPPVAAVLATAEGKSRIRETVFDNRLLYAEQMAKMGAEIEVLNAREAVIGGVPRLRGAEVEANNIRDGAAMVIAALCAEGESTVRGRRYVARGYEKLEEKLRSLGADIAAG